MSISANINTAKTIRDYLGSIDQQKYDVEVTITTGTSSTTLTNVDLTWDGQNYYILGNIQTGEAPSVTVAPETSIYKLDNVLPLKVKTTQKASK